jgi:hypothetical protein
MSRRHRTEEGDAVRRQEGAVTRSTARGASQAGLADSTRRGGDAVQDEGGDSDGGRVRPKKKKNFHGCFSTDHVQEVIATFGEKKLSILDQIGLGSLTHLKPGMKHSRGLVCSLLKK